MADNSPIPTRPALARVTTSSKRKVPPIPMDSNSSKSHYRDEDSVDSARDSIFDDEDDPEMIMSLSKIRNSATKKKAEKIFKNLSRSPSPPESMESGIHSNTSTFRATLVDSSSRTHGAKKETPFETKPKIIRKSSKSDQVALGSDSRSSIGVQDTKQHAASEFNPRGGVTFQKNHSSDVQIRGIGYGEETQVTEPKPSSHAMKAKDRRKPAPHKRMFDTSPGSSDHSSSSSPSDRPERRPSNTDGKLRQGVVGLKVRNNSQDQVEYSPSSSEGEDEEEDIKSMSMSKATKQHLQQKQEAIEQERIHAAHIEAEKLRKKELKLQREALRRVNSNQSEEDLRIAASGKQQSSSPIKNTEYSAPQNGISEPTEYKKSPAKTPPQKRSKPPSVEPPSHPGSAKSSELELAENLKRFKDPYRAYDEAMKLIANNEWEIKCNGVNHIRSLTVHHPEVLVANLHTVIMALIQEVKNLRSQVSRLAIVCLGDMYNYLKKHMDLDLDQTAKVLLAKNAECSGFIRADVDQTMAALVDNVTPQRALTAIITGGASHKNVAVRKLCSQHLGTVAERMGPGRVLSGVKDLTDRILPVAAQFMLDANPETRYNGQKILYMLMSHEEFDKMMNKYVPANTLRNIADKLDNLKKKGLVDPPSDTSGSARGKRPGQVSRSNSVTRNNSATSETGSSAGSKRTSRTDEATLEEIKAMATLMSANDWRDRQTGIQQLLDMTRSNPNSVCNNVNKIFDKFVPCLKDSNSKVNLFALQAMEKLVPALKDRMGSVINLCIQTVASNLSSKNQDIYRAASDALTFFMDHLDPSLLLHPFANQAQSGNTRIKPDMITRVAYLSSKVYPTKKQKQVILHVLPLLWHLLGSNPSSGAVPGATGNLRSAISQLVQQLNGCMGPALLDHANTNSIVTPRIHQALQDMLDNP